VGFTIRGEMTVDALYVTLTDGREVTLLQSGSMHVRAGEHDSNEYVLDLPTVADVARTCDANGRHEDGEVMIPVHHRH